MASVQLPFHRLVRDGQTVLLHGLVFLLSLSEAPVGRGVGQDGVGHRVGRVALHAVLDVTNRQLRLQEKVELTVRQAHSHMHHSARAKGERRRSLCLWLIMFNCQIIIIKKKTSLIQKDLKALSAALQELLIAEEEEGLPGEVWDGPARSSGTRSSMEGAGVLQGEFT